MTIEVIVMSSRNSFLPAIYVNVIKNMSLLIHSLSVNNKPIKPSWWTIPIKELKKKLRLQVQLYSTFKFSLQCSFLYSNLPFQKLVSSELKIAKSTKR